MFFIFALELPPHPMQLFGPFHAACTAPITTSFTLLSFQHQFPFPTLLSPPSRRLAPQLPPSHVARKQRRRYTPRTLPQLRKWRLVLQVKGGNACWGLTWGALCCVRVRLPPPCANIAQCDIREVGYEALARALAGNSSGGHVTCCPPPPSLQGVCVLNDGGKQVRALHEVWFFAKQGLGSAAVSCGVMIRCFKFVIRG